MPGLGLRLASGRNRLGAGTPAPPAWLSDYLASRAGSTDTVIAGFGHSLMAGAGTGAMVGKASTNIASYLAPLVGGDRAAFWGDQGARVSGTTFAAYDTRVSLGDWVTENFTTSGDFEFLGGDAWRSAVSNGASRYSFTPGVTFNRVTLYHSKWSGGPTITVYVDGASQGTISCNGSNGFYATTITVANGTTVSFAASGTFAYIAGMRVWNSGTKRTQIINAARWGAFSAQYLTTGVYEAFPAIDLIAPDLSLIMLDGNDMLSGTNLTTFQNNLAALITKCKTHGSVLVISDWLMPNSTPEATQLAYHNASKAAAAAANVGFLGLHEELGSGAVNKANGLIDTDNIHGTPLGYQTIAGLIHGKINY